jgi:hypothetical protein
MRRSNKFIYFFRWVISDIEHGISKEHADEYAIPEWYWYWYW